MMATRRIIPSIDWLRRRDGVRRLEARYGGPLVTAVLRDTARDLRAELERGATGLEGREEAASEIERRLGDHFARHLAPTLRRVINATGVIVHTNLGRAPLAASAIDAVASASRGYTPVEYDLDRGERGGRGARAALLLQRLTGAERALVVNNNAAAVLLTLSALAAGREVIISRGELVEIGGGFRIPDVLRQSGAILREVGTTNRTRANDYAAAIGERTALILRVHPSNFRIEGFTARPAVTELVDLGHRFDLPVVEDLGSGLVTETGPAWPAGIHEPTVTASLEAGVTICCISGDKLLGGPQAGLILGHAAAVARIEQHPLLRAVRADKLTYAALEATALEHLAGRAARTIPVIRMIAVAPAALRGRADDLMRRVAGYPGLTVTVADGRSVIGGGTTPTATLASVVLEIQLDDVSPDETGRRLRYSTPPVIARIEHDRVRLDLRTVAPDEDDDLVSVLRTLSR